MYKLGDLTTSPFIVVLKGNYILEGYLRVLKHHVLVQGKKIPLHQIKEVLRPEDLQMRFYPSCTLEGFVGRIMENYYREYRRVAPIKVLARELKVSRELAREWRDQWALDNGFVPVVRF